MIWQQQTAADAHRQLLLADAIACGSSLSCYSVVDGITMMAVDAASDYHSTDMKKSPGLCPGLSKYYPITSRMVYTPGSFPCRNFAAWTAPFANTPLENA